MDPRNEVGKLLLVLFHSVFIWKTIQAMTILNRPYDGLIKYLKEESKVHQVMFVLDDYAINTDPRLSYLVRRITQQFPSLSISSSKAPNNLKKDYLPSLKRPRRTTLFVMTYWNNKDSIQKYNSALNQIRRLSIQNPYPKLLILAFDEKSHLAHSYELLKLWNVEFVDVSKLSYIYQNTSTLEASRYLLPWMHQFNLFINIYTLEKISPKTQWFPEKLNNLNGHKLELAYEINLKNIIKAIKMAGILAHVMKFTANFSVANITKYGKAALSRRAQILLNTAQIFNSTHAPELLVFSHGNVKAVIPKIKMFTAGITVSQEFIYMVLVTIGFVVFIRVASLMFRFKNSTWQTLSICQVILGMSVTREPKKLSERVFFGSILITCVVYTGYFYSVILDVTLQIKPGISTLEELAKSSLTPMADFVMNVSMSVSSVSYIKQLSKRTIEIPGDGLNIDCLTYLEKYQNVTCLITSAPEYVNSYIDKNKDINMKILSEPVGYFLRSWIVRGHSPYIDKFNKIIQMAIDCGLLAELLQERANIYNEETSEDVEKEKLLLISIYTAIIGYTLSIMVFLVEVFVGTFGDRVCGFCVSFFRCIC